MSYLWNGPNGFTSTLQYPVISNPTIAAAGTYSVIVTNAAGCQATATTNVQVTAAPVVLVSNNGPLCTGSQLSLSANGTGTFYWTGPNGFSSFQQNPVINNVTLAASGLYSVTVTNTAGCSTTAATNVVISPVFTALAASNSPLCAGSTLSLNASAGTSWSWTGPNGFSSLLQNPSILNISAASVGTYTVTVTNAAGCTSTATVNVSLNTAPVAVASNNGPVCEGGSVTLNAAGGVSYNWTGPNGFSSTQQNPVINNVSLADAGSYTVVVTNAAGCVATASTNLQVNTLPVITLTNNGPICAGSMLNLSTNGTGTYSWTGPNGFTSILQNPSIGNVSTAAAGLYSLTITNASGCSVTVQTNVVINTGITAQASSNNPLCAGSTLNLSSSAGVSHFWTGPNGFSSLQQNPSILNATNAASGIYTVTITSASGCTSTATTNVLVSNTPIAYAAANSPVCAGTSLSLSASGGTSYSWTGPNGFISQQQNPVIPNVSVLAEGTYTVTVSNANGCTSVTTTDVTVIPNPTIATQPASQNVCTGNSVTFSVSANNATGYQWRKNGINIPGANSSMYTIPVVSLSDGGNYSVLVSNSCANVLSGNAALTVAPSVVILSQPSSQTICSGSSVTFSVATNNATVYQWKKNGNDIPGANGSSYTIASIVPGDAGNYSVLAVNSCSDATSSSAVLVVNTIPTIATQPVNQSVCTGNSVTFSVVASSNATGYQWRKNGTNISGATNSTYTIPSVNSGHAGNYTVIVKGTCGNITSDVATLRVDVIPVIGAQPVSQTICLGNSVTFSVTASDAVNYQWRKGGTNIPGATGSSYTIPSVSVGDAGNYRVIVYSLCGSKTSNVASLTINTLPAITAQPVEQHCM